MFNLTSRPAFRLDDRVQYVTIALLTLLVALQVMQSWKSPSRADLRYSAVAPDFKDFYCAGATLDAGENPYLTSSFERCGTARGTPRPTFVRNGIGPAPIPPYDLAVFRLFAMLPYVVAAYLWLALSILALTYAVVRLAKLSACPPIAVFAAFALTLYYNNLAWGNVPPLIVGALIAAAYALKQKAYARAGLACVATLIEPHLGLPVCIAVFCWAPRTRRSIVAGVLGLGILSLLTVGFSGNFDYFNKVLPLQANAEVPSETQYSFTWLAYLIGMPEGIALRLGTLFFVAMATLGIYFARRIVRVNEAEEFLPVVPAAFVVFGGTFVHVFQTSVSLALGIMLLKISRRASVVLMLGVILQIPLWYSKPWLTQPYTLARFESAFAIAAFVLFASVVWTRRTRIVLAFGASAVYIAFSFAILHAPRETIRAPQAAAVYAKTLGTDMRYSTGEWGRWIRDTPIASACNAMVLARKIPIWLGLLFVLFATIAQARGRSPALQPKAIRANPLQPSELSGTI